MTRALQSDSPTFHLIPHTHWDREWYLPQVVFQARLVAVLDDALSLLERDPTARLTLDGQTVLLEDYLAVRPEAEQRIGTQVLRGALDVGPWYILADEQVPSGESLIRNLLEGARDALHLGRRMDVLYSPDAFGHPAILPALGREFGIGRGALWRGLGNPVDLDRDFYQWRAANGATLLVHHLPPAGYETGSFLAHGAAEWGRLRLMLLARSVSDQVAVFVGADHHAIPDLRVVMPHIRDEATYRVSTLGEFLRAIPEDVAEAAPLVEGELRNTGHTWVLQGVHGTRARMKRHHGSAELVLSRIAEPLAALAALHRGRDRRALLRRAWRMLLRSQFHDTLGGCCVDDVARDQERRLDNTMALAREIAARSLDELLGHDPDAARESPDASPALVLWNPSGRRRGGIVTAELTFFRRDVLVGPPSGAAPRSGPGHEPFTLGDRPVQVLAVRRGEERVDAAHHHPDQDEVDRVFVAFRAEPLDGLGTAVLRPSPGGGRPARDGLEAGKGALANRFVNLSVSPTGALSLTDWRSGAHHGGLAILEDEPDAGDTYSFARGAGPLRRLAEPETQRVLAKGPLVGAVETCWSMRSAGSGELRVRQVIVLHADSPIVRIRLDVQNLATDHRLRARFPVGAGAAALAGMAFGSVWRDTVKEASTSTMEMAVATAPAHRYVAAADQLRGLAILAPAFFEYEWTAEQDLIVTLIRSVGQLSRDGLAERPGHAGWPESTPLAEEWGDHRIDLALAPTGVEALQNPDRLEALWEDVFLPLQTVGYRAFTGSAASTTATLEGDGLVFSTAKPPESGDGVVLRCWNAQATEVKGSWKPTVSFGSALRVRADETMVAPIEAGPDGSLAFTARPHDLVTVKLVRDRAE